MVEPSMQFMSEFSQGQIRTMKVRSAKIIASLNNHVENQMCNSWVKWIALD